MKTLNSRLIYVFSAIVFCANLASAQVGPAHKLNYTIGSNKWAVDGSRAKLLETVRATLGNDTGFYIALPPDVEGNQDLSVTQFGYAFRGSPEPEIQFANGRVLFIGSDPNSPSEKAFVVTDGDRRTILALAILHQSCGGTRQFLNKETGRYTHCPDVPTLTFFIKQGETVDGPGKSNLIEWVKQFENTVNDNVRQQKVRPKHKFVRAFNINTHVINTP